jgi:hypothetical protein
MLLNVNIKDVKQMHIISQYISHREIYGLVTKHFFPIIQISDTLNDGLTNSYKFQIMCMRGLKWLHIYFKYCERWIKELIKMSDTVNEMVKTVTYLFSIPSPFVSTFDIPTKSYFVTLMRQITKL